jgi:DNA-binding IclR family transcriptional regulator
MDNGKQRGLTQSVSRALSILNCFTDETPELRVTDISSRMGLTSSLVSRLLQTLEADRLVEQDTETGFYHLGPAIITLAGVTLNHNRLRIEALNEMQAVANALELGVNLAILDQDTIFYLAHIDGPRAPRSYTLIGRRNPLHATGMGKVLLANQPEELRDECIDRLVLHAYTAHTITSRDTLVAELEQVVIQGWGREMEELALGRACIASPIRDKSGTVIAALSISGPLSALKWDERQNELINMAIEAADRISIRLGYVTAPWLSKGEWRPPQRINSDR